MAVAGAAALAAHDTLLAEGGTYHDQAHDQHYCDHNNNEDASAHDLAGCGLEGELWPAVHEPGCGPRAELRTGCGLEGEQLVHEPPRAAARAAAGPHDLAG